MQHIRVKVPPFRTAIIALVSVIGSALALQHAMASVTARSNPAFALGLLPSHGVANAAQADKLLSGLASNRNPGKAVEAIEKLARKSVRESAINVRAVRILGYLADYRGRKELARDRMAVAARLSKRDFATQLWHIEDRVAANDAQGALAQYDVALRANYGNGELLYPQLAEALSEPAIRQVFRPYFAKNPSWLSSFISFALNRLEDPSHLGAMVVEAGGLPRDPASQSLAGSFLIRLVDTGHTQHALALYRTMPGADRTVPQSAAATAASTDPRYPPIAWQLFDTPGADLSWQDSNSPRRSLVAALSSGERSLVARKLVFASPGAYSVSWKVDREGESRGATAGLAVRCTTATKDLIQFDGSGRRTLQVPKGCGPLVLEVTASGGDDQSGANFVISDIALDGIGTVPSAKP